MKKDMKDHIKSMSVKEMQGKLQELETERFNISAKLKGQFGYPKTPYSGKFGNIQRIKKDIARIKTWLNIKLKAELR